MTITKTLKLGIMAFALVFCLSAKGEVQYSDQVACQFNNIGVQTGGSVSLPVIVNNEFALSGWQCDITVPDGFTITGITLNPDRISDHTGNYSVYSDQTYRYVVASLAFNGTTGNTGPLFFVKLQADAEPGEYEITLSNFRCTDTDRENTQEYLAAPYTGKLTVVGAYTGTFELVDGQAYDNTIDYSNVDVTYSRNFTTTTWQPLYVPFNMSYEEWSDVADVAELYNVRGYDNNNDGEIDEVNIEFNKLKEGSEIQPNIPYIIRAKNTGEVDFDCHGKRLMACPDAEGSVESSSTKYTYTFYGIYETKSDLVQDGLYYLKRGSFTYTENTSATLAPYRAYLMVREKSGGYNGISLTPSQVRKNIRLYVEGEEISNVFAIPSDMEYSNKIYDLCGREVSNPQKGIYLKDGKKIFIK